MTITEIERDAWHFALQQINRELAKIAYVVESHERAHAATIYGAAVIDAWECARDAVVAKIRDVERRDE
jgi:hypothetical protein